MNSFAYPSFLAFQSQAAEELAKLRALLTDLEKDLSHAPPGYLCITKKGSRTWYYQRDDASGARPRYLGEKDQFLRSALAQKSYDLRLKRAVLEQIDQLERGLALNIKDLSTIYDQYEEPRRSLVEPRILPTDLYIKQWLAEYGASASGDRHKSKSEYILITLYKSLGVPFIYEPRLYLEGYGSVRPDFVALNVRTRQTFYHEHFGKMDDPDYCRTALAKLEDYHRNGFREGINFIVTMESSLHPLEPADAESTLRALLL